MSVVHINVCQCMVTLTRLCGVLKSALSSFNVCLVMLANPYKNDINTHMYFGLIRLFNLQINQVLVLGSFI
jgi:hypothetical protein